MASGKEGAATTYHLVNDQGEYSRVKDVRFTAFAKRSWLWMLMAGCITPWKRRVLRWGLHRKGLPQNQLLIFRKRKRQQKRPR